MRLVTSRYGIAALVKSLRAEQWRPQELIRDKRTQSICWVLMSFGRDTTSETCLDASRADPVGVLEPDSAKSRGELEVKAVQGGQVVPFCWQDQAVSEKATNQVNGRDQTGLFARCEYIHG